MEGTFPSIVLKRQGPSIYSVVIDRAGELCWRAAVYRDALVVRLTTGGALDVSFAGTGWTAIDFNGFTDYLTSVAIDGSDRIVAGGRTDPTDGSGPQTNLALLRLGPTGNLDTLFGPNASGKVIQDIGSTFDVIHGLVIDGDRRILVSAEATAPDYSTADTAIARFTTDGRPTAHSEPAGSRAPLQRRLHVSVQCGASAGWKGDESGRAEQRGTFHVGWPDAVLCIVVGETVPQHERLDVESGV